MELFTSLWCLIHFWTLFWPLWCLIHFVTCHYMSLHQCSACVRSLRSHTSFCLDFLIRMAKYLLANASEMGTLLARCNQNAIFKTLRFDTAYTLIVVLSESLNMNTCTRNDSVFKKMIAATGQWEQIKCSVNNVARKAHLICYVQAAFDFWLSHSSAVRQQHWTTTSLAWPCLPSQLKARPGYYFTSHKLNNVGLSLFFWLNFFNKNKDYLFLLRGTPRHLGVGRILIYRMH